MNRFNLVGYEDYLERIRENHISRKNKIKAKEREELLDIESSLSIYLPEIASHLYIIGQILTKMLESKQNDC